ncbi:methionine ABC transporter substrate-binding protein [Nocardia terpenica]|uniref:MetQ/NlpA family ABC transporter substrate-binding protein n=1 Tax=Nocardia terpenica TaxID=455432 RepID=UPI0018961541|nr:MetQ/NlpA family ABC transporter substrate-binding protein [Nocardia terpenica]MBF6059588.1 methionine ABC transporter substrate-binding protein [Nocardia terpenica]MBF6102873.1 methionine ABC transporter substrate-binding protein [Nocardia terpenica]MBF6110938.1 methionine ABC transporter substrate-binding protein [Nocardia terpenica]MBF6117069.1 methionine ABC transporter substrate-binding protein [Nocardia terpenica]MBF6151093.1 methionine ABC transporter substrate-binding protein [Nocar
MRSLRRLFVFPILLALAAVLTACGERHGGDVVRIGVNDLALPHWNVLKKKAAAQGIAIEYVNFSDYNQPNPALSQGRIDLNKFQHVRYLANYNARNNDTLVPIAATEIFPLALYSKKHRSVAEIPQGGQITLSNNPANQVRPLLSLAAAGLVALKGGPSWDSKLTDVDTAASKVRLTTIDPTLTAQSLDSVDAAFVDDTFAQPAGLTQQQVILTDDPQRPELKQYINIFAARAKDKDDPRLLAVTKLYHDPEVEAAVRAESGFDGIFKTNDAADLQATLAELEAKFRR